MATAPASEGILTVSEITRRIKDTLGAEFPAVWVRGELTGFKRAPKGHCYFSLKDSRAVLDCMMWAQDAERLVFEPRDGTEIEAFGSISVYEPRGRYQLYVAEMRVAGIGALLQALEELKRRLQAEGLFDATRKQPLPRYPVRIGLVTSPVGAAVRDLVKGLRARWPSVELVLAPVKVQGDGAAEEIAAAIGRFNRYGRVDVLIVGRGGGSLEDLWAFNQEVVVRAIATSAIPVISAVGHEVDVTLADLAADVRAATPSNAAELAVPDRREVQRRVEVLQGRLGRALRHGLAVRRQRLDHLVEKYGFQRQREAFRMWQGRVDEWVGRMRLQVVRLLEAVRARFAAAAEAYGLREWPRTLTDRRDDVDARQARLRDAWAVVLEARRLRLAGYDDRLRALSPRRVMERGYCLVRGRDGTLLRSAEALAVGDAIQVEFARGEVDARVEAVRVREDHGE